MSTFREILALASAPSISVPRPNDDIGDALWSLPEVIRVNAELLLWRDGPDAAAAAEEPVPELLGRRKRPEVGQFRLLVDRQTKASFTTFEEAEKAAMTIKTGHPIVSVVVYDAKAGENHVMELAKK